MNARAARVVEKLRHAESRDRLVRRHLAGCDRDEAGIRADPDLSESSRAPLLAMLVALRTRFRQQLEDSAILQTALRDLLELVGDDRA